MELRRGRRSFAINGRVAYYVDDVLRATQGGKYYPEMPIWSLYSGRHMKILAIEHDPPDVRDDQFTAALRHAEARRAWELQQAGVIRELYFRAAERSVHTGALATARLIPPA